MNKNLIAALHYMFEYGLIVDQVTNEDEPQPTIWLTGNMPLDKLNVLLEAAGMKPLSRKGLWGWTGSNFHDGYETEIPPEET